VIVRVRSQRAAEPLPDAVFSFRAGDPQYDYWEREWRLRQMAAHAKGES
jgi:hypothetical protein